MPAGGIGQGLAGGTRDGFGQIEQGGVFPLAEVLGLEQLGQAHHLGAQRRGRADAVQGLLQVQGRIRPASHLHQARPDCLVPHYPRYA